MVKKKNLEPNFRSAFFLFFQLLFLSLLQNQKVISAEKVHQLLFQVQTFDLHRGLQILLNSSLPNNINHILSILKKK